MADPAHIDVTEREHRAVAEQAALRRIATLIAADKTTTEVCGAVVEEVVRVLGLPAAWLLRYEAEGAMTVLAAINDAAFPVGSRWPLDGSSVPATVFETGLPARIDDYSTLTGAIAVRTRESGCLCSLGVPILIDGGVWGAICASTADPERLPADTEKRLAHFTDLVAIAVSNVVSRDRLRRLAEERSKLLASRARIVAAGDEARRRIERDLHDGTQQRLVAIGLDLKRVEALAASDQRVLREGLERLRDDLESVLQDVRELSRGLHSPGLSRRGLRPAVLALARQSPIPVEVDIDLDQRPPETIETAVYCAVSEALANAIKHSNASGITVTIAEDASDEAVMRLHAAVVDDGDGGALPTLGSGLIGLADRIDALGGQFTLDSPAGHGTTISIMFPFARQA